MKYIKVKDLFEIKKGKKVEQINEKKDGAIRYIQIDDLRNDDNIKYCVNNKYVLARKEDIIIAWDGANAGTIGYGLEGAIGSTLAILSFKDKGFMSEFCGLFLKSKFKYLRDKCTGATIPHISKQALVDLKMPNISLEKQKEIVNTLRISQELIDKRKAQIEDLDELVKSRFIEMFGDPVLNPKRWVVKSVIDVCDCMVPGRDKPKSFTGDIPWITIEDLNVNGVTLGSKSGLGLTDKEIDEVHRKKVPLGSVIMSCVGNLGICSIAGTEMIINQQLHSFQCKNINNIFLMYYLGFRKDYMNLKASNTTVLYMNKTICNSIPVYQPPIELQNQFASFVKQVDKLKFEMEQSLKELEDNFNSLMQRAFKGELFN
ncbi:restriction endonuclease subunit S [Inconstantimicrobium porci]|uniref:Type I restriction modification DNA specificity domain-containing protein n=1 Tax=Inconstantimicrobium porci TaxID=2652291 RepID=A0A7X2T1C5_9CLOT|nr:restriction endonuclease subunit S [Inconstantimicrobium porci]MSR91454.1 hypothetical protein [Inconstantimicrobium porci]